MPYPVGVQISTLTFSNPGTFLGYEATRTEVTFQATAGVVWAATGQPIDDFPELVSPGEGMPGSLTSPFVNQEGFTDQAGNDFQMWAYIVTRKSFFGSYSKIVKKNWQPLLGQTTIDFDNLPGGAIGLPVATPPVPVTSVAGLTLAVGAEDLAGELVPFLPDGVTPESVAANLPARLGEGELSATILTATEAQVPPLVAEAIAADNAPAQAAAAAVDTALAANGTVGNVVMDRGQWDAAATYERDDLVTFVGKRWAAQTAEPGATTTTTRTNRIPNPRFANNRAGWSAGTGVTAVVVGETVELTVTTERTIGTSIFLLSADVPAVAGEVWSERVTVSVPSGASGSVTIRPVINQYPGPTSILGTAQAIAPGATVDLVVQGGTVAADKTGVRMVIQAGGTLPVGTVIVVSKPLLEKASTAGTYFSGATADTTETDYAWSGTVDASASTATTSTTAAATHGTPGDGKWTLLATTPTPTRTGAAEAMDFGNPAQTVRYPGTINRARTRMWSFQAAAFAISYDDGLNWTVIYTFAHPVRSVRALDNGEVIVSTRSADNLQPHELWLSKGMQASPSTATWTKVMTGNTAGNGPVNGWSWSVHGEKIMCADYGTKAGANNARHVYFSDDYGNTWRTIYDLGTAVGNHVHGVGIDEYWDRLWISYGDDTNGIVYSDDLGATWQTANLGSTAGAPWQAVGIIALPHCILFASDGTPNGVWRISRTQGKHSGIYEMEIAYQINEAPTITHLCHYIHRADRPGDDAPTLFAFGPETVEGQSLLLMTRDGYDFTELWEDPLVTPAGQGLNVALGPTARGQLVMNANDGRQGVGMTRWAAKFPSAY